MKRKSSTEIYGKIQSSQYGSKTDFRYKIKLRTPINFVTFIYYMAGSVSGQDELNPAL